MTPPHDGTESALAKTPRGPLVDRHYADIRCALEAAGTPIGSHDTFIVAHARSRGMTLVTHDLRKFRRVPGLVLEDWLAGTA
ncbi:hypothetical protein BH11PSE9_BH11PSE9_07060 [soil metagenome]